MTLALGVVSLQAWAACEPTGGMTRVDGGGVIIGFKTQPARIQVGEMFGLEVVVCPRPGREAVNGLRVDALMPDHRHGMNYLPKVVRSGEGNYSASGMMFHMPGRWQFIFDVDTPSGRERLHFDYPLE